MAMLVCWCAHNRAPWYNFFVPIFVGWLIYYLAGQVKTNTKKQSKSINNSTSYSQYPSQTWENIIALTLS